MDQAAFAALNAAITPALATDDSDIDPGTLAWAAFRLAHRFRVEAAGEWLAAHAPKPAVVADLSPDAAAAWIGYWAFSGRVAKAKKLGVLLRRRHPDSARLAFAVSLAQAKPKAALRLLETAESLRPGLSDVTLARAWRLVRSKKTEAAVELVLPLLDGDPDLDLAVDVCELLLAAGRAAVLESCSTPLTSADDLLAISPARQSFAAGLLVHRAIRRGDLRVATRAAEHRALSAPEAFEPTLEWARLVAFSGGNGDPLLARWMERTRDEVARARATAERVRLAIVRADLARAQELAESPSGTDRRARAWLLLASGWVHEARGDEKRARSAFAAAARADPRSIAAKAEKARLAARPRRELLRLEEIGTPWVDLPLARLLAARGETAQARERLERVLWRAPLLTDPVAMLLDWIELLDAEGESDRSREILATLQAARPKDERPVRIQADLAMRHDRPEELVAAYRVLQRLRRHDPAVRHNLARAHVLLGAALIKEGKIDAGKNSLRISLTLENQGHTADQARQLLE